MELGPIWRAAMRNKTGVILIVTQIALTLALMINGITIVQERTRMMARPSGVDETNTFHLNSAGFSETFNAQVTAEEDLRAIRSTPGVASAIQMNAIPLSGGGWSMGLKTEPGDDLDSTGVAVYFVDEYGLDALGVELIAGENFSTADVTWRQDGDTQWPDKTVLSRSMAEALFPEDFYQAVGSTVYIGDDQPMTVVGIVDRLQAPWNGWDGVERSMLVPQRTAFNGTRYFIRAEPDARDTLMPQIEQLLAERNRERIIAGMQSMEDTRERSYRLDFVLITILLVIMSVLLAVTTLGVGGLTNFNVTRRTKEIGTRRALGATRPAILRYFLVENLLFTSIGVVLGAVIAIGLNMLMVEAFNIPRMPWYLIPTGIVVFLVVGQLAVYFPARRAALVSPAVATRTV